MESTVGIRENGPREQRSGRAESHQESGRSVHTTVRGQPPLLLGSLCPQPPLHPSLRARSVLVNMGGLPFSMSQSPSPSSGGPHVTHRVRPSPPGFWLASWLCSSLNVHTTGLHFAKMTCLLSPHPPRPPLSAPPSLAALPPCLCCRVLLS